MTGDFNETRSPSKRSGSCRETTRRSQAFTEQINDNQLLKVEFSGAHHTWAHGLTPKTRQSRRLDRALCNGSWSLRFEDAKVGHLPVVQFDHCLIFISANGFVPLNALNRPFRFQATWLTHEKFQSYVKDKWFSNEPLVSALSQLASDLQIWNKEVFGNLFIQKNTLLARTTGIQHVLSSRRDRGLIKHESKLRLELDDVPKKKSKIMWYQKSRIDWINNGDRNTTFFHLCTVVRRWKNNVTAIKDNNGDQIHD